MTQTYIVLKTEWHYNDEFYYREGDGGVPVIAYTDKSKALAECDKRNVESARNRIAEYIPEDGFCIVTDTELRERLDLTHEEHWDYRLPKTASDADILTLLKTMNMEFFVVKEVQVQS